MGVRILLDGDCTGAQNMARDLELLREARPTIRLYGWRPACVSLGYPQPESDVDAVAARELGLDVVRRPTGGGAILHAETEITYAVILPRSMAPADLFASYRLIAQGVRNALQQFELASEFLEGHSGREPLCYLREEGVSVGIQGRKISGGAQKRTKAALLQHGTLLVDSDVERNARLFRLDPATIQSSVTSLRDQGVDPARAQVRSALLRGFASALAPVLELEDSEAVAKT